MMLTAIDTHAHLDQIEDIELTLREAQACGVVAVMAVGVDLSSSQKNLRLKKEKASPKIFWAGGIHPGEIKPEEVEATLAFLKDNVSHAAAVGEIGLDFWYRWVRKNDEKKQEQLAVFRRQLEFAKDHQLPVIIHSRGAWGQCLEEVRRLDIAKAVFHWYSGPLDVLKEILDRGYYVSATPSLAYSPQAREAIAFAPLERTLIETDCPVFYKAPDAAVAPGAQDPEPEVTGFAARPRHVWKTLEYYAGLKRMEEARALEVLNQNARDLFGISF